MKRLIVAASLLVTGFAVGLVLSGQSSDTTPTIVAAPAAPAQQSKRGAMASSPRRRCPDLSDVAERAVQSAVNISSTQVTGACDPVLPALLRRRRGSARHTSLGSGVIVSPDGYVLTNNHVIGDARADIKVTLPDNRELPGKLVGIDTVTDLAVVKVDAQGLAPLPWGDSSKLRVAQWVLAIGNPFAFSQTVTLGIVSRGEPSRPAAGQLRGFDSDRRGHQPGQLGRRADQQQGRARRDQHDDLQRDRRLSGHRLRDPGQPRARGHGSS